MYIRYMYIAIDWTRELVDDGTTRDFLAMGAKTDICLLFRKMSSN